MIKDYYKILNVNRESSLNDIKKSFRSLALHWHPDKNSAPQAKETFLQIYEAYEILANETKRENYNILYDEYFLKKVSIINPVQRQYEYEKYNEWRNDAQNRAYEKAKMTYKEFAKFIRATFKIIEWGCTTLVIFALWLNFGPGMAYNLLIFFYEEVIFKMQYKEFSGLAIIFWIFILLIFLFNLFVTIAGIVVFFEKKTGSRS